MRNILLLVALSIVGWNSAAGQRHPVDSTLTATFARWGQEHRVVGIAAGWLDGPQSGTATGGSPVYGSGVSVTDSTVFEIGSITKVFTGTLLASMVLSGDVALDDPVAKYLPGWTIPQYAGREITLLDLATQSSGLPRMPDNFKPLDALDPYADYDDALLKAFLGNYQLTRAPGARYEYSNLAMGLLGRALAGRAGKTYEALLRERILAPLRMSDTRVIEDPTWRAREATGYSAEFMPLKAWHFMALQSAGALRSSTSDMLRFAAALRDTTSGPIAKAMAFAIRPRRPLSGADSIGLAWNHRRTNGMDIVWHNGATGGFRSWLSADLVSKRAVVVVTNASIGELDAIGLQLQRKQPLAPPQSNDIPTEITLPASALEKFVGRYEFTPQFAIDVTQQGDSIFAQATGQLKLRMFAESPTTFFYKLIKAKLLFSLDPDGKVSGLTLLQGGVQQPARKVR